ncbi:FmdB family zinc ribbon protein [Sporomusa acidovorans]|uniref:Putative regulatory protein FmdB zinc ribbon domain-containing protein n=1 Tax=Sporomusa acidovorans (strain ATCC 49682 / DSM 3132 / Mol) TaxID=1123286 RepID=A0ABZ3J3J5_SPOA4|nr:zinc ribbon domain-containing protein [Sporomusa acidovorans]
MPIYNFICNECGEKFEQLCRISWQGTVTCPACKQTDVKKVISLISSHGRSGGDSSECSGKSCSGCSGCK